MFQDNWFFKKPMCPMDFREQFWENNKGGTGLAELQAEAGSIDIQLLIQNRATMVEVCLRTIAGVGVWWWSGKGEKLLLWQIVEWLSKTEKALSRTHLPGYA